MEAFPEAKVVVTVREPSKWYNSVKNTIFKHQPKFLQFPIRFLVVMLGKLPVFRVIDMIGWTDVNCQTSKPSKHTHFFLYLFENLLKVL